jgi:ABC-type bacteriocin/lantibiotic exporter with double-glycine peptidase domain
MMLFETPVPSQRFFIPEVVQTSAMDCGPAALKAILEGFGIPVSYGRLREACQTDVDGTSINTIEDIAVQLGLQAEQVMVPPEHLLIPDAQNLPAIVVVRLPSGLTHFLVVWSRVGNFLQVMDPATGRRWPTWEKFQEEIFMHTFPVPAQAWRDWAGTDGFLAPLRYRFQELKISSELYDDLIRSAVRDPGWRYLAALDAALRMTSSLVKAKGIMPGEQAGHVLQQFYERNRDIGPVDSNDRPDSGIHIPGPYWSVLPVEPGSLPDMDQQVEMIFLRGAVLVRILGLRERPQLVLPEEEEPFEAGRATLPPDLEAALREPPVHPEREVINALREDGLLTPGVLMLALLAASLIVIVEALLFQGIIQIGQTFTTGSQRLAAVVVLLIFVTAPFLLEFPISSAVLRMGRRLEARMRIAFLSKLPRLGDRYFHSRLTSDMTQRAHDLRSLRQLPGLGVNLLRTGFQLILTMIGVIWLDPISAPLAIVGTLIFVGFSVLTRPLLEERDLRMRTHIGALSRFYLDGLLGLIPVKTHSAERAMRRQHESQMVEWVRTGRDFYNWAIYLQSIGILLYSTFAILIVMNYITKGGQSNEILLLFYWTLNLPVLGQSFANQIQQYPMQRNRVLRLLEPLSAPDEEEIWFSKNGKNQTDSAELAEIRPVSVEMKGVEVQAGGHVILEGVHLEIQPGEHLAIVGPSGAGKSTLIGLLLGWHRPAEGSIQVDGKALDGSRIQTLRQETAWVDPAIQLWNRSFYDNLRYGNETEEAAPIGETIQDAELFGVLERLPDGLKTNLGEGGGLVSGGEGQRVRLGRAMLRQVTRLVLLDEPFRGLDRDARRRLLIKARQYWHNATLICITHDVSETLNFPRVLVIEDGRIIEDADPHSLAQDAGTRYYALLEAEQAVRRGLWSSSEWKRWYVDSGKVEPGELPTPDVEL